MTNEKATAEATNPAKSTSTAGDATKAKSAGGGRGNARRRRGRGGAGANASAGSGEGPAESKPRRGGGSGGRGGRTRRGGGRGRGGAGTGDATATVEGGAATGDSLSSSTARTGRGGRRSRGRGRGRSRGGKSESAGGDAGDSAADAKRNNRNNRTRKPIDHSFSAPLKSPAELVDIGVNLTNKRFSRDSAEVLRRCSEANVTCVVLTGTSVRESRSSLALVRRNSAAASELTPGVRLVSTAGVHPHAAERECGTDEQLASVLATLEELVVKNDAVVAVGETGLDFDRDFSPRHVQERVFDAQVKLAVRLNKPIFLHERSAHDVFVRVLRANGYGEVNATVPLAVVHCFTGTEAELDTYLAMGLYVGVTGFVVKQKRGAALRAFVAKIPLDRLMIETDAPFMGASASDIPSDLERKPFVPLRNRNEPCLLPLVARVIADAHQAAGDLSVTPEIVAQRTTENARRFFALA